MREIIFKSTQQHLGADVTALEDDVGLTMSQ
jgi:hypothetical protein